MMEQLYTLELTIGQKTQMKVKIQGKKQQM